MADGFAGWSEVEIAARMDKLRTPDDNRAEPSKQFLAPPEHPSPVHNPASPLPSPALDAARKAVAGASCRILTDGKMGDLAQCLGVAEALGLSPDQRIVSPRAPFTWLMPWGPIDPRDKSGRSGSPVAPPFPDIAIASGRRAVAYLRALKKASGGKTFTVFLKDPKTGPGAADFIWAPEHDCIRGPNVLTTLTSPHRLSQEAMAIARAAPPPWREHPPAKWIPVGGKSGCENKMMSPPEQPLIGLLVGGPSKDIAFTDADCVRFCQLLEAAVNSGARLVGTPSRRTPDALAHTITTLVEASGGTFWNGTGDNPYRAILAHSDAFIVTAESVNMVGEAASTGRGIHLFRATGSSRKIDQFLRGLDAHGATRPFQGAVEVFSYEPMDSTPVIAAELARRFARHGNGD